jgi:hypothetical protein
MFQLVEEYELKYKQFYKIIADDEYKARFNKDVYLTENYYSMDKLYLEFDHVYNITTQTCCEPLFFLPTRKFYKFVSQKERIQSNMEHRAVNLIIRQILGDNYFKW